MNTNSINVLGYSNNSQFVVKTRNANVRIDQDTNPEPYEYLLAGVAGYINTLGRQIAQEQRLPLRSLQVEISGRPGRGAPGRSFESVDIILKPSAIAPLEALQKWLDEVQRRSPAFNTLLGATRVDVILYKEFSYN